MGWGRNVQHAISPPTPGEARLRLRPEDQGTKRPRDQGHKGKRPREEETKELDPAAVPTLDPFTTNLGIQRSRCLYITSSIAVIIDAPCSKLREPRARSKPPWDKPVNVITGKFMLTRSCQTIIISRSRRPTRVGWTACRGYHGGCPRNSRTTQKKDQGKIAAKRRKKRKR
jgi:hypothetical protein